MPMARTVVDIFGSAMDGGTARDGYGRAGIQRAPRPSGHDDTLANANGMT
jgi:hypothetical protein